MPAYCAPINFPEVHYNSDRSWTAKTIRLTNIDRHVIGQQIPADWRMIRGRDCQDPIEKLKFIVECADHAVVSYLQNNEQPLKIKPDENGHYIVLKNGNLRRDDDNTVTCTYENPMRRDSNVYQDIQAYNSFITAFRWVSEGIMGDKIDIEIETQNYILEEFDLGDPIANPANPNAYFNGVVSEPRVINRFSTNGEIVDDKFEGNFPFEGDKEIFKRMLKRNLKIITRRRGEIIHNIPENERVAIETLREMITETAYRKFTKYGFILVKGNSGRFYQIFRNMSHTKVWQNGKIVEEICVRIANRNIPPTDNLIAFKTMIETDENEFRNIGNVYNMTRVA